MTCAPGTDNMMYLLAMLCILAGYALGRIDNEEK